MKPFIIFLTFLTIAVAPTSAQPSKARPVDATLAPYASTADSVTLPDGRKIHFVCMGRGSPTVILTAGLGDWAASWSIIQPEIAKSTRVCAWDRPGFGLSDAAPQAYSVAVTAADLEAALAQGSIGGPYVLVGHSLGAYESLIYADRHPERVPGMVLVDPAVPGQAAMMKRVAPAIAEANDSYSKSLVALIRRCAAEARDAPRPLDRPTPQDCSLPFPSTYPPALIRALKIEAAKPAQAEAVASFQENFALSGEQAINPARNYANKPLIVLTATEAQAPPPGTSDEAAAQTSGFLEAFNREHDALAALSTRGINARVPGSSHYIHQIKPQVVIDAVSQVVAEVRKAIH